jgi:two-component system response regulator NreC
MHTVAIVDDHALFRAGLRALLETDQALKVVAEAGDAEGAFRALRETAADVVVLDVSLPGVGGIALGRELLRRQPRTRLLALTMFDDEERVARAFEGGIHGYAVKAQPASEVMSAIHAVAEGRQYLAPSFSRAAIDEYRSRRTSGDPASPLRSLTAREREIFDCAVRGLSNSAIAEQLGISRRTVETHRSRILRKLHAHTAVDLVRLAAQHGLLDLEPAAGIP